MAKLCGIPQHTLGSMDTQSCKEILQLTATRLKESDILEVVHLCRRVPLLVRLAGKEAGGTERCNI